MRVPSALLLVLLAALSAGLSPAQAELTKEEMKAAEEEFARLFAAPAFGADKKDLLARLLEDGSARSLKLLGEAVFLEVDLWWGLRKQLETLAKEHAEILARGVKVGFVPADEKRVQIVQQEMAELDGAVAREREALSDAEQAVAKAPEALRKNLLKRARSAKEWPWRAAAARVAALTLSDKESWEYLVRCVQADPDPRVRLTGLDSLATIEERWEDLLLGALGDADWSVRLRAVQIVHERKLERAIPHLINALAKADPRLAESVAGALHEFTGESFGPFYEQWSRWWEENGKNYKEKVKLAGGKREAFAESHFYGIPIRSNRVLFVIDISGSMKEPTQNDNPKERWKPAPPTTGGGNAPPPPPPPEEILSGPKIEVAKHELSKAVERLPSDSTFNIICFNQGATAWQPQQMIASKQNKDAALQWIRAMSAHGTTYIDGALRLAFRLAGLEIPDDKYPEIAIDTMMVLSDGAPTDNSYPQAKRMDPEEILQHVRTWNQHKRVVVHAIGISKHDGVEFLKKLAQENGGTYVDR